MHKALRFVEDDNAYSAGDFGDEGEDVLKDIASGDTIVVGMVVFDAEAVEAEHMHDPHLAYETAISRHLIDSLWCITVDSRAINDTGKEIQDPADVTDDYLRHLAYEALGIEPPQVSIDLATLRLVMDNFGHPGPFSDDVDAAVEAVRKAVKR